jgi:hypothetical protein
MSTEKNKEDFLIKEIESWKGFEYALREENRILASHSRRIGEEDLIRC